MTRNPEIQNLSKERRDVLAKVSFFDLALFGLFFKKISKVYHLLFKSLYKLEEENKELRAEIETLKAKEKNLVSCPTHSLGDRYDTLCLPEWYQTHNMEKLGKDFKSYVEQTNKEITLGNLQKRLNAAEMDLKRYMR